jgi:predicted nuclease of predicted toxin-antitoxin system
VRVLIDAQLPQRLARFLSSYNIDAKHTLDLPKQNATPDSEVIQLVGKEERIVITKDGDFWDSYILEGYPEKLLIVSTGNINNARLIRLFELNIEELKTLFEEHSVIEISEYGIQIHY